MISDLDKGDHDEGYDTNLKSIRCQSGSRQRQKHQDKDQDEKKTKEY